MIRALDQKIDLEYTPKMEKALREIAKEDKRLFAEIAKKIGFLQNGELEKLDLSPIHRKHGKHQINEIRIKSPESYRVFYVCFDRKNNRYILVDGRRKKVQAFSSAYFQTLDAAVDRYIQLKEEKNE